MATQFQTPTLLTVTIRSEDRLVFQDQVKALTSKTDKGTFDILPRHANFISLIKDIIILYKRDGIRQDLKIEHGLLRVADDKVNIYLGVGGRSQITV